MGGYFSTVEQVRYVLSFFWGTVIKDSPKDYVCGEKTVIPSLGTAVIALCR